MARPRPYPQLPKRPRTRVHANGSQSTTARALLVGSARHLWQHSPSCLLPLLPRCQPAKPHRIKQHACTTLAVLGMEETLVAMQGLRSMPRPCRETQWCPRWFLQRTCVVHSQLPRRVKLRQRASGSAKVPFALHPWLPSISWTLQPLQVSRPARFPRRQTARQTLTATG